MVDKNIRISVVIPVFNAELYIEQCIESCLQQKLSEGEIEVIAVDDNSRDSSSDILKKISERYSNVQLVRLTQNRGPAGARNEGIKKAKGQFIAFLDADDFMADNKLKIQLSYLQNNNDVDLLLTGLREIDEKGNHIRNLIQRFPEEKNKQAKAFFLDEISSVTPTVIFRRDLIERVGFLNEGLDHFEDKEFLLRVLKETTINYLPKPLTVRRVIKNSFSNTVDEITFLKSREIFFDIALKYFPELKACKQKYWQKQMFGLGRIFQKRGDFKKAREYYKKSLNHSFNYKAFFGRILSYFPRFLQQKISSIRF